MAFSSRRAASLLAAAAALLTACGCGSGSHATTAGLHVQRQDLIATSQELSRQLPEVRREVAATKAAWPLVAGGPPASMSTADEAKIVTAARVARALKLPSLFQESKARGLTGAGAALAGTFGSFYILSSRGWPMLDYLLHASHRAGAAGSYARGNAPLYIEVVYDAHFGLSQIGKKLTDGYAKLGGPKAFGSSLTQPYVDRLAAAYSEAAARLHPHARVKFGA
jgi:hypothetical protein